MLVRKLLLLALLFIISCKTDKDEPYQGTCFSGCSDAGRMLKVDAGQTNLNADSLSGRVVRTYTKDNTFSNMVAESAQDTFYIEGNYDYEIYYPAIGKSIRISQIQFRQIGLPDTCNTLGSCINPLDTVVVTFNGVPQEYSEGYYYTEAMALHIKLHQ